MTRPGTGSSLTQSAYEQLRADVLTCRLRPGERLRINDLCAALHVSLSAVREALSRLTSEGLVTNEPQRGFRVAPISVKDLKDLTETRIQIEALCLRRAIDVGDLAWEGGILAATHQLVRIPVPTSDHELGVRQRWADAHTKYHEALVAACDSDWLHRLRAILYAQSERYRSLSAVNAPRSRDVNHEHQEIANATLARDADRAVLLMAAHLRETTQRVLENEWAA